MLSVVLPFFKETISLFYDYFLFLVIFISLIRLSV